MTLKQGSGLCILCSIPPMFGELTSSRVQEESREEKGERGRQKGVKGRKIVAGRKRKMESAERKRKEQQGRRPGRPRTGRRLSSELHSGSRSGFSRPAASGSRPRTTEDNVRRICLAMCFLLVLFVCFLFFWRWTRLVEKQEAVRGVAGIDNGPQASRAGGILQWGLVGMDAGLLMSVGGASLWVPRTRWPAQAQRWFAPSSLSLSSPPGQERISP